MRDHGSKELPSTQGSLPEEAAISVGGEGGGQQAVFSSSSITTTTTAAAVAAPMAAAAAATDNNNNGGGGSGGDATIAQAFHMVEVLTTMYGFSAEAADEAIDAVGATDVEQCVSYILDQGLGQDTGGAIYPIQDCPHLKTCVKVTADRILGPGLTDVFERPCCYYHERQSSKRIKHNSDGCPSGETGVARPKDDADYYYMNNTNDATTENTSCPMGENWWCLSCSNVYCSRYVNGHGVRHWEDTRIQKADDSKNNQNREGGNVDDDGHCVMVSLADLSVWCHQCGAYITEDDHGGDGNILPPILKRLEEIKFGDETN